MYDVPQANTRVPLYFLLVLSSDHVTGATGKTPTVTLRKNGASSFTPALGAVTAIGLGWYTVAPNAFDADTLGPLALHATAPGCDPCDVDFDVVEAD